MESCAGQCNLDATTHALTYRIEHTEAVGTLGQIGAVVRHPGEEERDRRVGSTNDAEASCTTQQGSQYAYAPK